MTPQERDVINGIFERLKAASSQPRDPEAEKLIAENIASQPYAPYAMAQSVYVQEQALLNLQQQVETLQAQVTQMQGQGQAQSQAAQGGFLSSLFGAKPATSVPPVGRPPGMPPGIQQPQPGFPPQGMQAQAMQQGQPTQQPSGPWGGQQQPRQGGGFMQSAMATAAGVAGGVVLGNVLMNAFNGDKGGANAAAKPETAGEASQPQPSEMAGPPAELAGPSADHQQASHDNSADSYDTGFDDGGGDWA